MSSIGENKSTDDWEIIDIVEEIILNENVFDNDDSANTNHNTGILKPDDDEEEYYEEYDEDYSDDDSTQNIPHVPLQTSGISYRDAAISGLSKAEMRRKSNLPVVVNKPKREWKPNLVVEKVPNVRLDREYGEGTKRNYDDYDEDDGMWDLIYNHLDVKNSSATTRTRTMTTLTSGQAAKKATRIAQKPTA